MADFERRTKEVVNTYTMLDSDSGMTLICNKATPFTITLQSPTGRHFFDVMIVNIGAGLVTVGALTVGQYSHAHITNLAGTTWVVAIGGGAEVDPVFVAWFANTPPVMIEADPEFNASVAHDIIAQDLIDWAEAHTKAVLIPAGGAENELLAKNSGVDYDGKWIPAPTAANGIPVGGAINQLPAKASGADFDVIWIDVPAAGNGLPVGGSANQIPSKIDGTDFNVHWVDAFNPADLEYIAQKQLSQDLDIIDLNVNLETLRGATLTGIIANIFVETFLTLDDITLDQGIYDAMNRKIYF